MAWGVSVARRAVTVVVIVVICRRYLRCVVRTRLTNLKTIDVKL